MNEIKNIDCLQGLRELPDCSVNCCVTSPPYYGLRDYGHDGQIGLEATPEAYVEKMVAVFREVRRVLKDDGTLWLNLGDSYSSHKDCKSVGQSLARGTSREHAHEMELGKSRVRDSKMLKAQGLKNKDLIGIPWMVAFALRAYGWYLRQDIIWHKPNPMLKSVTDRCTKAHEYIFLLSKSQRYYYDADAIVEKSVTALKPNSPSIKIHDESCQGRHGKTSMLYAGNDILRPENRNKRSVWTVTTKPFSEAHFATFPQELIFDMIKACSKGGIVLDPFMGDGTTAVVSRKLDRNYMGFELNAEYIKIAEKRLFEEMGMFL